MPAQVQLNKQPTFQVLWMTIEEILRESSYAKTRKESMRLFHANEPFIWGQGAVHCFE